MTAYRAQYIHMPNKNKKKEHKTTTYPTTPNRTKTSYPYTHLYTNFDRPLFGWYFQGRRRNEEKGVFEWQMAANYRTFVWRTVEVGVNVFYICAKLYGVDWKLCVVLCWSANLASHKHTVNFFQHRRTITVWCSFGRIWCPFERLRCTTSGTMIDRNS